MVPRRRSVALVLLLASVLLGLLVPAPVVTAPAVTAPAATALIDTPGGGEPRSTGDETLTEPAPGEDGPAVHRALPRPARTTGAAGAGGPLPGAPVRAGAADRPGPGDPGAVRSPRPSPARPAPDAGRLRTFRC
ncbi:hypothetical protein [Streptomyces daghestanicus]|uniref:Secreted protein n=1 Tax=Streptomyces daghestanicus TaxID=66885 RepID=A0ABQ3QDJ6_9ACTN|nr:hypothetical protein [Streptomyces daghestanicus]GGU16297.1 hypothetical protein GCM10010259_03330 [Streptomyces daghestanicus]GHI35314.1 hypothetical protein Sdagh_70440 [Streptomyces daghestanicus]